MKRQALTLALFAICGLCHAKILRNKALMTKMVSNFGHKDAVPAPEPERSIQTDQPHIVGVMQNVLCKNFPTVPCNVIMKDATLRKLIERSIQQLKYKKLALDKTTQSPGYQLTLFPIVNSEELNNYLAVQNTGYFPEKQKKKQKQRAVTTKPNMREDKPYETSQHVFKTKRRAMFTGRKNIRKFYPHKIKYKDKNSNAQKEFADYSGENLSMSVEVPDMTVIKKHQHYTYRREPENPPVWRIDYTKHGEPSVNHFGYEPQLKGKVKSGPAVVAGDVLQHVVRKDVLHPDVYIKKNVRNSPVEINSDEVD